MIGNHRQELFIPQQLVYLPRYILEASDNLLSKRYESRVGDESGDLIREVTVTFECAESFYENENILRV